MTDWITKFHRAIAPLHRRIPDDDRRYLLQEAENARRAAKELGLRADRIVWSYHPQPRVRRAA